MNRNAAASIAEDASARAAEEARKRVFSEKSAGGSPQVSVTTTVIATPEHPCVLWSASQFAESVVQNATSLVAGVVITGTEFCVGVCAKFFDTAENIVRYGTRRLRLVQERGHQATAEVMESLKMGVGSVQQRGNDVLNRSVAGVLPTPGYLIGGGYGGPPREARAYGPAAQGLTESLVSAPGGALKAVPRAGQQALGKAQTAIGAAAEVAERAKQKAVEVVAPVVEAGKKATSAAAEFVGGTARDIELLGEQAAEAALEKARIGTTAAVEAGEAATEVGRKARELTVGAVHTLSEEASETATAIQESGEAAGESTLEAARSAAESAKEGTRGAMQTGQSMAGRVAGMATGTLGAISGFVSGAITQIEQQGEHAGEAAVSAVSSAPGTFARAPEATKESLTRAAGLVKEKISAATDVAGRVAHAVPAGGETEVSSGIEATNPLPASSSEEVVKATTTIRSTSETPMRSSP